MLWVRRSVVRLLLTLDLGDERLLLLFVDVLLVLLSGLHELHGHKPCFLRALLPLRIRLLVLIEIHFNVRVAIFALALAVVGPLGVKVVQVFDRLLLDAALRPGRVTLRPAEIVLRILAPDFRLSIFQLVFVPHHLVILLPNVGIVHLRLESAHLLAPFVRAAMTKAETLFSHLELIFSGKLGRGFGVYLLEIGSDFVFLTKFVFLLEFMVEF